MVQYLPKTRRNTIAPSRGDDREHDVVTNTGRSSDLLDAATGLEKATHLLPPLSLRPLATASDSPQCFEFVVRHCRDKIVGRDEVAQRAHVHVNDPRDDATSGGLATRE